MNFTFYFLFVIPGVILAYIVYLLIGHYRQKKRKLKIVIDPLDMKIRELESELKRIKEDD